MDLALLTIDPKEGVIALGPRWLCCSYYVGSPLYMVLTGVTLLSVTNPLTLFKIRFSESVTG